MPPAAEVTRSRAPAGRAAPPRSAPTRASASAGRERREADGVGRAGPRTPAGPRIEQLRTRHAQQEERAVGALRELLHEVEQGGLGPVDVVEDEDDRTFPSPRLQEAADRPGGLLRAARARQAEQAAEARGDRRGVGPFPRSGRADG